MGANDLAQQIYERLIKNDYRAVRNFRGKTVQEWEAYLTEICYHLIQDHYRRSIRSIESLDRESEKWADERSDDRYHLSSAPVQESDLERREVRMLIKNSLDRLDSSETTRRDRWIFMLRHFGHYSAKEVAQALGITPWHVNTIYCRVKKKVTVDLAKALTRQTGKPAA